MYKRANFQAISDDLNSLKDELYSDTDPNTPIENIWNSFKTRLRNAMDKHIPKKSLSSWTDVPWLSPKIKQMIRKKKRLYRKAKKIDKPKIWQKFKNHRRRTKAKLKAAYESHISNILNINLKPNPKKFWKFINSRRKDNSSIPPLKTPNGLAVSNPEKAEALNHQYTSVFTKENLQNIPNKGPSPYAPMPKIDFSSNGILKLLKGLNVNKATGPDDLPARVLKECAESIAPILSFIFDTSYRQHQDPTDWETANVMPVYKKDDKNIPSNYRPVSITSITCKIMEHILFSNMMAHLEHNHILVDYQHGFRSKHSTESQLITTIDDLAKTLNVKGQTDMIILDFSKAFDTVPHQRLLHKLKFYGIDVDTIKWIESWLTNRTQKVVVDGDSSKLAPVTSGVPQGTVLGPLLFLIYINDIGNNISQGSKLRLFADDCLLYRVISSAKDVSILQKDLTSLVEWADLWQMSFNAKKCFSINVTNKRKQTQSDYNIKSSALESVEHQPYLGVEIDKSLSFNEHIKNVAAKANKTLGFLRRNLAKCSEDVKSRAYTTLVRPQLEYASASWDPATQTNILELEKIQRRAVRFVFNIYDRGVTSITEKRKELGWPTLEYRRKAKRLTLFHKAVHGKVAINITAPVCDRSSRTENARRYIQPLTACNAYQNSFVPRTIKEWNGLPGVIANINEEDDFKTAVLQLLEDAE